jgi:lipopolysaccharide transport system ATP-binding protein
MSRPPIIEFHDVWKSFRRHTGRLLLRAQVQRFFSRRREQHLEWFDALKGVSFQVEPAEGVAVIGTNGAGKSTLLSLVAGLVAPDRGTVSVSGRIAALLELGSGFHPDLTGEENVRLNASLLGLSRKQLSVLFDEIIEFAELEDFIYETLRTYSTGMIMRLAFSVAINVDPDILLIDEVLAVGDAGFQAKCFDKILELRRQGKTLLCVSHAAGMVQRLCDRAIWLDHGDLMLDGPLEDVKDAYEGHLRAKAT